MPIACTVFTNDASTIEVNGEAFKVFWPTKTQKTAEIAHIHIGPEAVQAVEEYLKVREEWKPRKGKEDGLEPLFLNRFGQRFDAASIGMVFLRIGRRIGKKLSAHSLRKFHKTTLEGAGVPEQWIKKLQGKAADVYSKPEESGELTKKYIECYNALLIFGEQVSAQKLDEQTEQIEKLMAEVEKLRKENAIVHQLRIEKDEITQTLQDVLMHLEKLEQGNTKHF